MQAAPGFKVASSQVRFPSLAVPCFSILPVTNAGCGTGNEATCRFKASLESSGCLISTHSMQCCDNQRKGMTMGIDPSDCFEGIYMLR